jgi:hypothetical protein
MNKMNPSVQGTNEVHTDVYIQTDNSPETILLDSGWLKTHKSKLKEEKFLFHNHNILSYTG